MGTATKISLTVADSFASIASTVAYTYTAVTNCKTTDASLDACAIKDVNSPCVPTQQGVNFINILRAHFSYESAFLQLHFGNKKHFHTKNVKCL